MAERTVEERFMAKVEKTDSCWIWTAQCTPGGYGRFKIGGRPLRAHRVAYELLVGPIPEGLVLDHLCRVRHCVNPAHLEPVTQRENVLRGDAVGAVNAAKTHCPQGHPYDQLNTLMEAGSRRCLACKRSREAGYQRRRRAEVGS
jgi:hypothetical protein